MLALFQVLSGRVGLVGPPPWTSQTHIISVSAGLWGVSSCPLGSTETPRASETV